MDEFNVIKLTSDLNELESEIQQWYRLPYKLRLRSNEECIRRYNCNIIDLYNNIKNKIMNSEAEAEIDDNNVKIMESLDAALDFADQYEDFGYLKSLSAQLQQSPFIVILDPDIISLNTLDDKYEMFMNLNNKNKRISNDYSVQLWGYNVNNMYEIIKNRLDTEDPDKNNAVLIEPSEDTIEACTNSLYDYYNHASLYNETIASCRINSDIKNSIDEADINGSVLLNNLEDMMLKNELFDISVLPDAVPFLCTNECQLLKSYNPNKSYYSQIKEAESTLELRNLSWNPFIKINECTIKAARRKMANYIDNCTIIGMNEISDLCTVDIDRNNGYNDLTMILLVINYPDNRNITTSPMDYTKIGISFDADENFLKRIYTFNGSENSFTGFIPETDKDYNNIDLVGFFVDKEIANDLHSLIEANISKSYEIKPFTTMYSVINKVRNRYSPDLYKIIYSQDIDTLIILLNDYKNEEYKYLYRKVYKLYSGPISNLDMDKVFQLINIIGEQDPYKKSVLDNFKEQYSDDFKLNLIMTADRVII